MTEEAKPKPIAPPQFIPKLIGQKVLIRLVSGGQPMAGVIIAYNPYEIMVQTPKGQIVVFKSAIATIETVAEPKK
jgi:sRNA-binding regulator protein Hfq